MQVNVKNKSGFTLIEFLVSGILLLFLLVGVVPNYVKMVGKSRVTSIANELSVIIQSAKIEAIRSRNDVVVCASSSGTSCDGEWDNVIMFVDKNKNEEVDGAEVVKKIIQLKKESSDSLVIQTQDTDFLVFDSLGLLKNQDGVSAFNLVLVCSTQNPKFQKFLYAGISETKIKPSTSTSCP